MKKLIKLLGLAVIFTLFISCQKEEIIPVCEADVETIKMNEIQLLGSHNSYRKVTTPEILSLVLSLAALIPEEFNPMAWDYNHEPLIDQLNTYGIRSIELDVYRDPIGGLFYNRMGNGFVGLDNESGITKLEEPGLKVLHFPDFDYNTHFLTFTDALEYIRNWSSTNPNHLPFTILVEAKEDSPYALIPDLGLTATLPFTNGGTEEIENEILDVFGSNPALIFKPDDLRGDHLTLRGAVLNKEWPELKDVRGKIIFILMARQEVIDEYINANPNLARRMMFVFTEAHKDEAAFLNINDPVTNYQDIYKYVLDGFMVRTQADSNTTEARSGDYTRMNQAFNSGAQIICTDFYRPDPRSSADPEWSDYEVKFPDNQLAMINHNADQLDLSGCTIAE